MKHKSPADTGRQRPSRRRPIGIKWTLFLSFLVFSGIMLMLLWMFQVVFMDSFYRAIKTNTIKSTAETITRNVNHAELDTLLDKIANDRDINILIIRSDGEIVGSAQALSGSMIHHLPLSMLMKYFDQAEENGGAYLEKFNWDTFDTIASVNDTDKAVVPYDDNNFDGPVPRKNDGTQDAMIFARTVKLEDGFEAVILLNAMLTPVTATVDTLRVQLVFITAILVILSLGLALLQSRRISGPIIRINRKAHELAQGNYAVKFDPSGYREIAELAETLNHAAHELNQVEALRRELIANISHDLRTPLTMISGYAEVMRDLPGENTPENIDVILEEARHLTTLVNDLLDLSKLQAGVQTMDLQVFNLTAAIDQILHRYNKLTGQEGCTIHFEADRQIWVEADKTSLGQVIYNLVNNAIHYTGSDRTVLVRQVVHDNLVRIEVKDSGEGIPADQLPYIWERYYKVDKVHKRASVGNGLGLSIVKGVLTRHKAGFGVESTLGHGSLFWFELPIRQDHPDDKALLSQ